MVPCSLINEYLYTYYVPNIMLSIRQRFYPQATTYLKSQDTHKGKIYDINDLN